MSVGQSPADWPKWSWLTELGSCLSYHPDVLGPAREQPFTEFTRIQQVCVSPCGRYIAARCTAPRSGDAQELRVADIESRKLLWKVPLLSTNMLPLLSTNVLRHYMYGDVFVVGCMRGSKYQVCGYDAATGSPVSDDFTDWCGSITMPHHTPRAGHYAECVIIQFGPLLYEVRGYAPNRTQLWARPGFKLKLSAVSACGRYYEATDCDTGHNVLLDALTGDTAAVFSFDDVSMSQLGAVDADHYLCLTRGAGATARVGFELVNRWVSGDGASCVSSVAVRGKQNLAPDFDAASLLPAFGRCRVLMVVSQGSYIAAVSATTAEVLNVWHTPKCVALWFWTAARCAAYEHERALDAAAAVGDSDAASVGDSDAATEDTGLVRAVLAGLIAEAAQVAAKRRS